MLSPDPEPFLSQGVAPVVTVVTLDAVVTSVTDPGNVLGGTIALYDAMTGVLEYDDSVADRHKKADSGRYVYGDGSTRIRCEVSGSVFESDANALNLTIRLLNDKRSNRVRDTFDADSKANLDLLPGVGVTGIALTLTDYSATALNDDMLFGLTISMADWTDGVIVITGVDGWRIEATPSAFRAIVESGDGGIRKRHAQIDD